MDTATTWVQDLTLNQLNRYSGTGDRLMYNHAVLDDENKELQQKLATLKVESRQKEAVNQALAQEVAECRQKQQNSQLGEAWLGEAWLG